MFTGSFLVLTTYSLNPSVVTKLIKVCTLFFFMLGKALLTVLYKQALVTSRDPLVSLRLNICSITLYPMIGLGNSWSFKTSTGMCNSFSLVTGDASLKVNSTHPLYGMFAPLAATRSRLSGASVASEIFLSVTSGAYLAFHSSYIMHTWEPVSHNASVYFSVDNR